MQVAISEFYNGNRKAVVNKGVGAYSIEYYIDERVVQKTQHWSRDEAEDLAENFVYNGGKPVLLNEHEQTKLL